MSLTNPSAAESWPCYFISPDGLVQNKLEVNVPGILISDVDISTNYYDVSKPFRIDAINGKLNSGQSVEVPKSVDWKSLY
jgi:deaminated glutathione amidase